MTYGPAYDAEIDQPRLGEQLKRIRHFMLGVGWRTLSEIEAATGYPQASISADLRHLTKPKFGGYEKRKRRRPLESGAVWEYLIRVPLKKNEQEILF